MPTDIHMVKRILSYFHYNKAIIFSYDSPFLSRLVSICGEVNCLAL